MIFNGIKLILKLILDIVKHIVFILALTLFSSITLFAQKKVVFILIDGVPTDVLERVRTPNIDAIAKKGAFVEAYVGGEKGGETETPTISAPGYMSLITGTWANKHNVWGNGVKDPNYEYWNIFRMVEEIEPDRKTAIFSTWEDNRTKLVGEGLAKAGNIKLDYAFDGFEKDTVRFPHKPDRKFILEIDELVSKEAARYISEEGPDVSWVYLEYTDDMGHKFGDSPQMDEAVKLADKQIGRIWEAVKQREKKHDENWLFVVTTDHGRTQKDGKGHGGQSDRERKTWLVTNLTGNFRKPTPIVDILPSMVDFLELRLPNLIKQQLDGRSFFR